MQSTSHVLMIRPVNFDFNSETAVNNAFQTPGADAQVQEKALVEFDDLVTKLQEKGVDVLVVSDSTQPYTPDSIFPNNWISFHSDGTICLFPMFAENRRLERKTAILEAIAGKFTVSRKIDFTHYEKVHQFLEGTGSMVLDREKKIAYACLSPRTNLDVLKDFCGKMSYTPIVFHSVDGQGRPIYHTNVMMCVADQFVVICLGSIPEPDERKLIMTTILDSGKEIIDISLDQLNHFAGNMLQIQNRKGEKLLMMSTQAYESLTDGQRRQLGSFNTMIHSSLNSIEFNGGGSARCMIAEVYLPEKK